MCTKVTILMFFFFFVVSRYIRDPTRRSHAVGGQPQFAWSKERYVLSSVTRVRRTVVINVSKQTFVK